MAADPLDQTPSWWTLFGAALLVGPTVLLGAYAVMLLDSHRDRGPRGPEFRAMTDSAAPATGFIAYVIRPRGGSSPPGAGCVELVHASGSADPRRLGCSGRNGIPDTIGGLSWTASGDLEVSAGDASGSPAVLRVYSGRAVAGAIAESDRVHGRRRDGATVRTTQSAEAPERVAQLVLTKPDGSTRTLVSVEGPNVYAFGDPQWSPDGKWILLSDIHGRLLIADDRGRHIRELLPPRRARSLIATPLLTWFQGRSS